MFLQILHYLIGRMGSSSKATIRKGPSCFIALAQMLFRAQTFNCKTYSADVDIPSVQFGTTLLDRPTIDHNERSIVSRSCHYNTRHIFVTSWN